MKFKALLTDNGVRLLEKRFLVGLEKTGKTWHVCLTPDHVMFLHNLLNGNGDGVQSIAQFHKDSLFDDYRISSNNHDRIAFSLDLSLLLRALRSAVAVSSSSSASAAASPNLLHMKLVKKLPPNSTQPMPFLTLETRGYKSAVIHDIPISKPLSRPHLSDLLAALDAAQDLPQTLVQVPDLNHLLNLVDRMKLVGDVVDVFISKHGDFSVQVSTALISLGAEFRRLAVIGEQRDAPPEDQNLSAHTRSTRSISRGDAQSVQVSIKHFSKTLHCHLVRPDCAYYGISPHANCLTLIFQFFIPATRNTDKSISLHFRLPLLHPPSS